MYHNVRLLALIPARGGSRGIPRKNARLLGGVPLLAHTVRAACESAYLDEVVVTTDCHELADIALQAGARIPTLRPPALATDTSPTRDSILHMLFFLEQQGELFDAVVLLQPTSPLRTAQHIDEAIETWWAQGGDGGLVSVTEVEEHPLLMRYLNGAGALQPLLAAGSTVRRQDWSPVYRVNGAIYINRTEEIHPEVSFNDNRWAYLMDADASIDIDEEKDWEHAERVWEKRCTYTV